MPRACSSGSRSVSRPVSARTSAVLPWSMCPAVPTVSGAVRRSRSAACPRDGAAKESNLPTAGLPRLPGFEGRLDHRARAAPRLRQMIHCSRRCCRDDPRPGARRRRRGCPRRARPRTATSRPPDVVASQTRLRRHSSTSSAKRVNVSACSRLRRLPPDTASPPRSSSSTPSIAGHRLGVDLGGEAARARSARAGARAGRSRSRRSSRARPRRAPRAPRRRSASVIVSTAGASSPSPWPRLSAVEIAPTPSGLVSTSASPGAPAGVAQHLRRGGPRR